MRKIVLLLLICILMAVPVGAKTHPTLTLKNGKKTRHITVKGSYVKLPGEKNLPGKTFLGWDTKKHKKKNPEYEAGEKIKVEEDMKLYAVYFNRKKEADVGLRKQKDNKHLIIVGDSRTVALKEIYPGTDITFIARGGKGLYWMKKEGEPELMQALTKYEPEETAVIFALGVNDLWNANKYVSYLNRLSKKLKGCDLYFLSVNPMNNRVRRHPRKNEEKIRAFNRKMQKKLKMQYIDTYTYLMKNGYSTYTQNKIPVEDGAWGGVDDGLHYGFRTCKRIFNLCLQAMSRS